MTAKKTTAVRLEPEQKQALDAIAKKLDRSRSWLLRRAVDEFIERHGDTAEGSARQ